MTWERTFAAHVVTHRKTLASLSRPDLWSAMLRDELTYRIAEELRRHGWPDEWLRRAGAPPITLAVSESHMDYWARNQVVILAECRALDLRTADILPEKTPLWKWRRVR